MVQPSPALGYREFKSLARPVAQRHTLDPSDTKRLGTCLVSWRNPSPHCVWLYSVVIVVVACFLCGNMIHYFVWRVLTKMRVWFSTRLKCRGTSVRNWCNEQSEHYKLIDDFYYVEFDELFIQWSCIVNVTLLNKSVHIITPSVWFFIVNLDPVTVNAANSQVKLINYND